MRILLIEDDFDFRETLKEEFQARSIEVGQCDSLAEIANLKGEFTHAVVDLRLKDESGLDYIEPLTKKYPAIKITMLTAFGSVATTVQAIKLGANNYLLKPCSFKELLIALEFNGDDIKSEELDNTELPSLYKREREYIEYVLSLYNGNISKAAESLGIRRQSLQRKLKKYSLKD